jgi:predicted O-methyltransferase YrrM
MSAGPVLSSRAPLAAASSALHDPRIEAVIARLQRERRRPLNGSPNPAGPTHAAENDPHRYVDFGFSIHPEQGDLIYLLCRSLRAKRVVEFARSIGMSTLYLAAAMRDNGGGVVIGSEIVPEKIEAAQRNIAEAGLSEFVEIREGDACQTLRDVGGEIDFALIDGWPGGEGASLALRVMQLIAPKMQGGAIAVNDNGEHDYLAFVRNPANGFRSMSLPLKGGTELSVKA